MGVYRQVSLSDIGENYYYLSNIGKVLRHMTNKKKINSIKERGGGKGGGGR